MFVLELAGEDDQFALAEAHAAASNVTLVGPGLATARSLNPDRFTGLAYSRHASRIITQTTGSPDDAAATLADETIDRTGAVAVHARNIRATANIDTQTVEHRLGDILTTKGFTIDLENPDHELRALFTDNTSVLAWRVCSTNRGYGERAPTDKPFFHPGAIDPLDARAIANLARARPGATILDVMCGTGGILVEAGLLGADIIGIDVQRDMVRGADQNLSHYLDQDYSLIRGDAAQIPLRNTVDAIVFDAPYGRQSKIESRTSTTLIKATLQDAVRLTNRVVMVSDQDLTATVRTTDWDVSDLFKRPVHRSLTRHIHILRRAQSAETSKTSRHNTDQESRFD